MGVNMCRISDMRDMTTAGLRYKASLSTVQHLSRVETFKISTVLISNLLDVKISTVLISNLLDIKISTVLISNLLDVKISTVLISNLLDVLTLDIFGIIDILKMICTWEREER